MIYKLNDDYLDTSKLEHVSNIKEEIFVPNGNKQYWFRYQINGYVYDSDTNVSKEVIGKERENLLQVWLKEKGGIV